MKKIFYLIFLFVFLTAPSHAIKIGLQENTIISNFGSSTPAYIINNYTGNTLYEVQPMRVYQLKTYKQNLIIKIDGVSYDLGADNITIKPLGRGFVSVKRRWYRGNLIIFTKDNKITTINNLNLEDYLLGVVPSEMPSRWNIEALKAQAIAARSYAIANLRKRATRGYDLKDTPEDQAYGGASAEKPSTTHAVLSTKGIVLIYNHKIIPAYYSASAGGHTVNSGNIWSKDLPFLRSVPSFDDMVSKNGHGVGMSQHGANNLAAKGYSAVQILNYFYKDINFGRLRPEWNL